MIEQISSFCSQTVGNKKEGSGINAKLIQEHYISKVHNSHKYKKSGKSHLLFKRYCKIVSDKWKNIHCLQKDLVAHQLWNQVSLNKDLLFQLWYDFF